MTPRLAPIKWEGTDEREGNDGDHRRPGGDISGVRSVAFYCDGVVGTTPHIPPAPLSLTWPPRVVTFASTKQAATQSKGTVHLA